MLIKVCVAYKQSINRIHTYLYRIDLSKKCQSNNSDKSRVKHMLRLCSWEQFSAYYYLVWKYHEQISFSPIFLPFSCHLLEKRNFLLVKTILLYLLICLSYVSFSSSSSFFHHLLFLCVSHLMND